MKIIRTKIKGCVIIEPDRFEDDRGYFSPFFIHKTFNKEDMSFKEIVQCNRSKSAKGVFRGFHYQKAPKAQSKIVEVLKGAVIDFIVDIRPDSPTYGEYCMISLTEEDNQLVYIERGLAHGFLSLEDDTIFQYFVDNDYAPELESGVCYDDKILNINWDVFRRYLEIDNLIINPKDLQYLPLEK